MVITVEICQIVLDITTKKKKKKKKKKTKNINVKTSKMAKKIKESK